MGGKIEPLDDKLSSITLGMSATTISFTASSSCTKKRPEIARRATSWDVPRYHNANFSWTALAAEMQGENCSLVYVSYFHYEMKPKFIVNFVTAANDGNVNKLRSNIRRCYGLYTS